MDSSDNKCVESCNLKYGVSEVFNQNVDEEQKVKQSKAHSKTQIFDDQTEQVKFDHLMVDVLLKTFDDDSEKKQRISAWDGRRSCDKTVYTNYQGYTRRGLRYGYHKP